MKQSAYELMKARGAASLNRCSTHQKIKYDFTTKEGYQGRYVYILENELPYCHPKEDYTHNLEQIHVLAVDFYDHNKNYFVEMSICKDCGHFFVSANTIKQYHKSGNTPYFRYRIEPGYVGEFDNNKYSILSMYGYTVGKTANLLPGQRQLILKKVYEYGLMDYWDICNYLDSRISLAQKQGGNFTAIRKWREDRYFMHNLQINLD